MGKKRWRNLPKTARHDDKITQNSLEQKWVKSIGCD